MQVILLEKINKLGELGDIVRVKDGYGRNFLIPQKKARRATAASIAEFEVRRAELEKLAAEKLATAETMRDNLTDLTVQILQKSSVDNRLFGSVTNADISTALETLGFDVKKTQIRMPEGPIKSIGEHTVNISLHTDIQVDINVSVLGKQA